MAKPAGRRAAPAIVPCRSLGCCATPRRAQAPLAPWRGPRLRLQHDSPFTPTAVRKRALTAWRRSGFDPIVLHECRQTHARLLIAAGVNAKAITTYLGHASIQTTFDLYGPLHAGQRGRGGRHSGLVTLEVVHRARHRRVHGCESSTPVRNGRSSPQSIALAASLTVQPSTPTM